MALTNYNTANKTFTAIKLQDSEDEFVLEDSTVEEDYRMTAALDWFKNLNLNFPEQIKIELIDGIRPGNDWQGVNIYGEKSLEEIQAFLKEQGVEVNFEIKEG